MTPEPPAAACETPRLIKRRWETPGGRYAGCTTCGGDLCVQCYRAHLTPSDKHPERNDDNTCPSCLA